MTVVTQNKIDILVGMIAPFGMSSVPTGWLACDGSAVSRTTYADLFTAIGTTWGAGDGSSTFALPDLEGAFLRGIGNGSINSRTKPGPTNVGDFQEDQFQEHRHNMGSAGDAGPSGGTLFFQTQSTNNGYFANTYYNWSHNTTGATDASSSNPHRSGDETLPFNAGVKYCIKY